MYFTTASNSTAAPMIRARVLAALLMALVSAIGLVLSPAAAQEGKDAGGKDGERPGDAPAAEEIAKAVAGFVEARGAVERAAAGRRLIGIGPPALAALRDAREKAGEREPRDAAIVEALDRVAIQLLALKLVPVIRERLETGLVFDGQYDDLKSEGPEALRAVLHIIDDEEKPLPIRRAAIQAVADLADPALLPRLRELESDPLLEPLLREELGTLMAILGDTHHVDRRIAERAGAVEDPDLNRAMAANLELSNLYYKIRNYSKAIECYDRMLDIFRRVRRISPEHPFYGSDRQLALHHYNAACSNALDGRIDDARSHLRKAVELDPMHFNNIDADGDLKKLRDAPGHADFKKELGRLLEKKSI